MAISDPNRQRPLCALALVLFFAIFIMLMGGAGDRLFADPDVFWHIASGRRILETGVLPWSD